ncbi:LysR family transcriptional regulator [Flavobacterium akiainvivens]|uniref:LysR family transcriptional regulator n=1 Tax=Flavobacterium akiainvivens TaxID=1202724 RepID=A0A0M8MG15_9FLAO|nr:hydrogen peroxide-inducible genes activator [Flavobacterium akiainvivens]KOS04997.1 LysR family transcriptional regulator [Flavobacterium akiainvivens]SFQ40704.1 LysR family transcriptional regulator, hydrogen peroxide-inducible genes activator [Flavobacterium akiainvivens]
MTIQQLRYIVALDEHRHFARAAEECNVTQPGLTIQLKNLEEEIGIKVFDRAKVPLKPTLAGFEIIERAKKLLREADSIRDYVVHKKNDLTGKVTIGVISTLSPYLMPVFIKKIKDVVPDVAFTIVEAGTVHLMHYLETGAIDIALMATPTSNPGLNEYPVFQEPFVACLPEGHSMANTPFYELNENDKPDLLLLQNEYCFNAQLLDICSLGEPGLQSGNVKYEINSIETLKNLVKAGMGFAILPQLSAQNKDEGIYKPFKDTIPVREISLVVADTFSRKLLLEKISETLWLCLPESLKQQKQYKKIRWNDSPYFIKALEQYKG